ncbi:c-type cytochrome [Chryseobacterium potabilaquae]|uniref:Cytochrome c-552 n=1 Tax=Chryseobacterium potabilaquae TaxID=2675057 RepID=A0A6N4X4B1_9FLAO|nr:c-type cytochrome [Chryseobacterium potabilaquae]CAA7193601.1 Cytochrome c-552 [Chryseobacterium potabilaquae]
MSKLFLTGGLIFFLYSCSKKENPTLESVSSETSLVSEPVNTNISGDQMIQTLDCSGCHTIHERMIGPSYQEIADKYSEKDTEMLASKIVEGGSGVWGGVPMAAHPQVSKEDAKKMIEYILTLKKK